MHDIYIQKYGFCFDCMHAFMHAFWQMQCGDEIIITKRTIVVLIIIRSRDNV